MSADEGRRGPGGGEGAPAAPAEGASSLPEPSGEAVPGLGPARPGEAPGAGAAHDDRSARRAGPPTRAEVVAHLAATRLFSLLDPASLARLASRFEVVRVPPGEVIARQGEVDTALWVTIAGALSIDRRGEGGAVEHLGYRGYGAVVGTRGVFTDEPRGTSVVALEPAELLVAEREELWAALAADREAFDRLLLPDEARRRIRAAQLGRTLDGEQEVGVWRRHWLELARKMIAPAVIGAGALGGASLLASVVQSPGWIAALAFLGLAVPVAATVWAFFDYYHDQLIVTTRRIVHIERTPFIDAQRSEAMLGRIQDIQVVIPGLVATVLGYGTIRVLTAGSRMGISFSMVPEPERVRDVIFAQVGRERERARRERRSWLERQVRQALGWEANGKEHEEGAVDDAPAEEGATWRGALWELLTYFWPKMRVQEGRTVVWRKHWWVLLKKTIVPLVGLVAVAPPFLGALVARLTGAGAADAGAGPLAGLVALGASLPLWPLAAANLVVVLVLWYGYEDWRNDRYILSDDHVVDVEALPFGFFEDRRQAGIGQIQDIRYRVPHMGASLLGYGHVVIETAAESGNFTFDFVYHPETVQQEIFERIERLRARQEREAEERQAEEMARWLAAYHRVTGGDQGDGRGGRGAR